MSETTDDPSVVTTGGYTVRLSHGVDGGNGASGPTIRFVPPIVRLPSPFTRKGKSLKFEGDAGKPGGASATRNSPTGVWYWPEVSPASAA